MDLLDGFLQQFRDPVQKGELESKELLAYLEKGDVDGAIKFKIDRRFPDKKLLESNILRNTVKNLLLKLFDLREQRLDSLTLEKAINLKKYFLEKTEPEFFKETRLVFAVRMFILRNLKNGTLDSIKLAVDAKNEFGVEAFEDMGDPSFQLAVVKGLHFNMLNDDRLYENNIEKIKNNFLSGQEHLLRKAASLAIEKLRNPSSLIEEGLINSENIEQIEERIEVIQNKYLKVNNQSFDRNVA
jgi:hypothetical protein